MMPVDKCYLIWTLHVIERCHSFLSLTKSYLVIFCADLSLLSEHILVLN